MPRRRRWIKSQRCYEICFRARRGLPFVAFKVIKFLIGAIIARVQRDNKVILCHDIWNGSHCHLIIVSRDSEMCKRFYGELQKGITDAIKRLLGAKHLSIWEGNAMVAEIADVESAIERISYLYANPAQDNLIESIDQFPGYSSWTDFKKCLQSMSQESKASYPWIRLPSIDKLNSRSPTLSQDVHHVKLLIERNKNISHDLTRQPNAWMHCFGIKDDQYVRDINKQILTRTRERELLAHNERQSSGKKVLGALKLLSTPIMRDHKPKKYGRNIFILTSIKQLRIQMIAEFKDFCSECQRCYFRWKLGDFSVKWPPAAFRPPSPPTSNLLPAWT